MFLKINVYLSHKSSFACIYRFLAEVTNFDVVNTKLRVRVGPNLTH